MGYVLAFLALSQVFSGWLPTIFIHPYAFSHQRELLYLALALGLISYVPDKLWVWHRERTGWCAAGARALHRDLLGLGILGFLSFEARRGLRGIASRMAKPTRYAALPLVLVSGGVALLLWAGAKLGPARDVPDAYLTLWQMQMAWGAVALPLLLFVIEFSEQRPGSLQPLPDVLTRHSLVLPILGVTLGLVIALGVGAHWLASRWSYAIAFGAFTISGGLTAWAFFRLIILLYDRQALRRRSKDLLLERFRDNLTSRLRFRLRSLVLENWIASQPLVAIAGPRTPEGQGGTLGIKAPDDAQRVFDVNLALLEALARHLATVSREVSSSTEEETSTHSVEQKEPLLLLNKAPGEVVEESSKIALVPDTLPEAILAEIQSMVWLAYRFEPRLGEE